MLHDVIQAAMGWEDAHLHEFRVGNRRYGEPSGNGCGEQRRHDPGQKVLKCVHTYDSITVGSSA